jgi:DNA-directed RNA polymerase
MLCFQMLLQYLSLINNIFFIQLGAASVNLVAGEKPADVYSGIAAR